MGVSADRVIAHLKAEVERRGNLLEDVINELDLSEFAIEKHGPLGTPPAELVKLVLQGKDRNKRYELAEKDREIERLKNLKDEKFDIITSYRKGNAASEQRVKELEEGQCHNEDCTYVKLYREDRERVKELEDALKAALEHEKHEDGKCGCAWTIRAEAVLERTETPSVNELQEAAVCAEYALSHPESDQQFALSALRAALSDTERGKTDE